MVKKYVTILENVLKKISVPKEKEEVIESELEIVLNKIKKRILKKKINVDLFIGGSYAKKTLMKKGAYDIDIYLRFDKSYDNSTLTKLSKKILRGISKTTVHGSRDYFRIGINSWLYFEVIPVYKIKKPEEAENITDLSYFHVAYVKKKIKDKKVLDGIKLAKAFCIANKTYGAESYVHGFSGYALELLVNHYGGFIEFLKGMIKYKGEKIVIDTEKKFKNKREVLLNLNGARLESPVILIDPTYKRRNALAALSDETFQRFLESAREFLKSPSESFFEKKKTNYKKLKQEAIENSKEFLLLKLKTSKQEGDIAGTKLLKFFNHLSFEFSKFYTIEDKGFEYIGKKEGIAYFILYPRGEILFRGPRPEDGRHAPKFKEKHPSAFTMDGRLYAKEPFTTPSKEFLKGWMKEHKKRMREMSIKKIKII